MTKPKFSRAPWKRAMNLSRNGSGKPRGLSFSRIVDANNQNVAYAYQRASRMEQIGNLNLMSAAPDMYALLQKQCAVCPGAAINQEMTDMYDCRACEIGHVLRKARGESEVEND